jgi:hypothetical protein
MEPEIGVHVQLFSTPDSSITIENLASHFVDFSRHLMLRRFFTQTGQTSSENR